MTKEAREAVASIREYVQLSHDHEKYKSVQAKSRSLYESHGEVANALKSVLAFIDKEYPAA